MLMLGMQGPATELRMGSLPYLVQLLSHAFLINILYAAIIIPIYTMGNPKTALDVLGPPQSSGLWPLLMAVMTATALADPQGSSTFLCFTVNNRFFPWMMLAFFSLFSMSLQLGEW